MKAIIYRKKYSDGTFCQVGTLDTCIVKANSFYQGCRLAEKYAGLSEPYRIEFYSDDPAKFYQDPIKVLEKN
jgi:hypothetical protein